MSELGDFFTEKGISKEKIVEIVNELKKNPMGALAMVQKLGLSPDANQKIMEIVMMRPKAIDELASELGITSDEVDSIKEKLYSASTAGQKDT